MRTLLVAAVVLSFAPQQVTGPVPVRAGSGIIDPKLVSNQSPKYTEAAMSAKIQGSVELEAVINTDGSVGDVRVIKSLDTAFGLDDAAVTAAKAWKFTPGADRAGTPVPVIVTLIMDFRLKDGPPQTTPVVRAPILADVPQEFIQGARVVGSPGLEAPVVAKTVEPKYTSDAMRARIQGTVDVDVVIGADGRVARARIARALDAGLDENALVAAKLWTFAPGLQGGQAVPVLARITLSFRLH